MAMTSNIKDFLRDTNKKIEKELEKQQSEGKKIIIEAHQSVINLSPYDTSYFKANHFLSVNRPIKKTLLKSDEVVKQKGFYESTVNDLISGTESTVLGLNLFKVNTIYIQNNLDYADRLEAGWSSQSSAMYGKTEQKIKRLLNQRIK